MDTTLSYPTLRTVKISFVWFLPLYCLGLIVAYILASTVFPVTIDKDKIFGFALSHEQTFNQTLFMHLSISIFFIALVQLLSRLKGVKISQGNSILAFLLMVNIFCFIIGINIPLLHMTKLWIFKEHISLTQVLSNLKAKGEIQLYYIMLIFTFFIPILKTMVMVYDIYLSKSYSRKNLVLSLLSKWAMLDVMIVGIIVSTMKSGSGFAEMTTGTGLTFFIFSVILTLIISAFLPNTKNS